MAKKAKASEAKEKNALINRKISPKLRLFANCDESVCLVRSERDASLAVTAAGAQPLLRTQTSIPHPSTRPLKKGSLKKPIHSACASVFVDVVEGADRLCEETQRSGNMATLEVPLDQIGGLAENPKVMHVEIGEFVRTPPVILSTEPKIASKPKLTDRKITKQDANHKYGKEILIGIIDVGGIAFAHEDFMDGEKTRIQRIWDMGSDHRKPPNGFRYGSEFTRAHLNKAIATGKSIGVSPYAIEPQAHQQNSSHATHVASIAAGNHGVCRNAEIACVMLALAPGDFDRRRSFYDSTRIVHAVEYLLGVAKNLAVERECKRQEQDGDKQKVDPAKVLPLPISINISLGTNGHAHDGSSAASRWIDSAVATPGRVVSVAAGNAGQEASEKEGDLGFMVGRIHSSCRIAAAGLTKTIDWIVVGDGIVDISENEMEVWYEPQDRFSVTITAPDGTEIGPVLPNQFIENRQLPDGTFISVYNELYRPANGANMIAIYLTPWLKEPIRGVCAGQWRVSIRGEDVRDGRFHTWIERDDPRPFFRRKGTVYAAYPSFFSARSNVDAYSVSSLACGERILSVGNYDAVRFRPNATSSQGPTRDGRAKPEILAPGTDVLAANGFAPPTEPWVGMTGTSMASPYAAGVAGLMLAVEPSLTAAQIIGIMRRTAKPIDDSDYAWKGDSGFGVIDAKACVDEAKRINKHRDIT